MSAEIPRKVMSGWGMLVVMIAASIGDVAGLVNRIAAAAAAVDTGRVSTAEGWMLAYPIIALALGIGVLITLWAGFFTLQPNQSAVLLLFGAYKGTVRSAGFHWANPFYRKNRISLRTRNFNTEKLKVNDQRGNPVEIGAVVVWRVENTAQACFDVDDYVHYVSIQSEAAVRNVASHYPYDSSSEHELSLRGSMAEVSKALQAELHERLSKAGVVVEEARLSHLAYASEIAGTMLRRQQAEAIVAARTRIVEGAVGMVELALEHLKRNNTVQLDEERKAAMVSNLLVVLCGEQAAQPVVNTGTLYT
ncbi:SPFH domain / Band 7 family protein [Phycisphaerae bacterium RAS1]|nr:SPFH domain / Band 7 family protein [Phycisphaerae bacterium RAS1]